MKTYLLPALFVVLLATAIVANAQFVPPIKTPSCNPTSPDCGVPPPINVGPQAQTKKGPLILESTVVNPVATPNLLEVKKGNIFLNNARIYSQVPPQTPGTATTYAVETNGNVSASGLVSTEFVAALGNIFLFPLAIPQTSPSYVTSPSMRPLCAEKATGKIVVCAGSTGTGTGTNPPVVTPPTTAPTIKINITNLKINNVDVPYDNDFYKPTISTNVTEPNSKLFINWKVEETPFDPSNTRVFCWPTGTIPPTANTGTSFKTGFVSNYTLTKTETFSLACRHLDSGLIVHKSINFFYTATNPIDNTPDPLPADAEIDVPLGSFRYNSRHPIIVNSHIRPNGTPTKCYKTTSVVSPNQYNPASGYNGLVDKDIWTGNTMAINGGGSYGFDLQGEGKNSAYGQSVNSVATTGTNTVDEKFTLTCDDFIKNCKNLVNVKLSVQLELECYNGNYGQTKQTPSRSRVRLDWIFMKDLP